jgi:hypothetical protein
MRVRLMAPFILVLISFSAGQSAREISNPQAERIRRFAGTGSSFDAITEANYELTRIAREPLDLAVLRICSKESMPAALSVAAANPFTVAKALNEGYNFAFERILFLRSEDCVDSSPNVAATELWAVPRGATLPTFVQSIKSTQVRVEYIGTHKTPPLDGLPNYKNAVRQLIAKLGAREHAVGIVLGYYYRKPDLLMQDRLHQVENLLQMGGVPKDRYIIRLMPWAVDHSVARRAPEPKYPSISVIEIQMEVNKR